MTYKIRSCDLADIAEQNLYSQKLNLKNFGMYKIKKNNVFEDIALLDANLSLKDRSLMIESNDAIFDGIYLNFNLEGNFRFNNKNIDIVSKEDHTTISYISNNSGKVHFNQPLSRSIGLFIGKKFLEKNLLNDLNIEQNVVLKNEKNSLLSKSILKDIINSPYEGSLNNLYTQSKVLEILFHEFSYILNTQKLKTKKNLKVFFSEKDKDALNNAYKILKTSYNNPPTIKQLSKIVALNEFKLKVGLKEIFNETPHSIVKKERMIISESLLKSSDYNINEISKLVGFKSQSHFTKEFYNYHKVLPKDLMKSRKYYY